jgi:hypothetical protein
MGTQAEAVLIVAAVAAIALYFFLNGKGMFSGTASVSNSLNIVNDSAGELGGDMTAMAPGSTISSITAAQSAAAASVVN